MKGEALQISISGPPYDQLATLLLVVVSSVFPASLGVRTTAMRVNVPGRLSGALVVVPLCKDLMPRINGYHPRTSICCANRVAARV